MLLTNFYYLVLGDRVLKRRATEIEELTRKLDKLKREYEEVTNLKVSLEKEISTYRDLLEGTGNREGLKQIVDHVLEEARRLELEKITGAQTATAITHSTISGGTPGHTTVNRTVLRSSATGPTPSVSCTLHDSGAQNASYSATSSASSTSYSYRASYQEQS